MDKDRVREALVMRGTPGTVKQYDALLAQLTFVQETADDALDAVYALTLDLHAVERDKEELCAVLRMVRPWVSSDPEHRKVVDRALAQYATPEGKAEDE